MGVESIGDSGDGWFGTALDAEWILAAARTAGEGWLEGWLARVLLRMGGIDACRDTRVARVPEQAMASRPNID